MANNVSAILTDMLNSLKQIKDNTNLRLDGKTSQLQAQSVSWTYVENSSSLFMSFRVL